MSRFVWIVIIVLVAAGGWWLYHQHTSSTFGSGLVTSRDTSPGSMDDPSLNAPASPPSATQQPAPAPPATRQTAAQTTTSTLPLKPSAALPVSDTIDRSPPNGTAFTGAGKYTWYRQGNITWRVNSETGAACIAFATMEEWRKKIVSTHGCGST